ncbi:hypothetical protein PUNSTDRAFT_145751 [Punctularia strigosozonata HHB-11173 SS5]|uniref:uncharacterized protein n=1 Tax=Punctularia strigosozonata (strain HHB-11173) TaxID=741275 RepID=UPI0004417510|nr:uncharacterized protein PUNSTDRAFT_145751 [Punctularia strigosozonata HHB-11173 SS5]EIN05845.1 hypothetical protein PUNSTDRAFT_145751 [Punctularia strigosozonata HHB-11173 SS5]
MPPKTKKGKLGSSLKQKGKTVSPREEVPRAHEAADASRKALILPNTSAAELGASMNDYQHALSIFAALSDEARRKLIDELSGQTKGKKRQRSDDEAEGVGSLATKTKKATATATANGSSHSPQETSTAVQNTKPLPYELERYIFEMNAWADPVFARKVSLTAKRVHVWMTALLHNHIMLQITQFNRGVRELMNDVREKRRPPGYYEAHVKSLSIPYNFDVPDAIMFLEAFPKLRALGCWVSIEQPGGVEPAQQLWKALIRHAPEKLSLRLLNLFENNAPDWNAPIWQNVTHLEIVDSHIFWMHWKELANLPKLTHLSLYAPIEFRLQTERLLPTKAAIKELLENNPRLKVVGLNATMTEDTTLFKVFDDVTDPRLVFYQYYPQGRITWAWFCHVRGLPDVYKVLEEFSEKLPAHPKAKDRWCKVDVSPTELKLYIDPYAHLRRD